MSRKSTSETCVATVVAVALALALVVFRAMAVETAYPVEKAKRTFVQKVLSRLTGFVKGAEARAENVRLRREAASLAMLKGEVERLELENARLRRALAYAEKSSVRWIAADVLSFGGGAAGAGDTIRVGRGSLDGVEKNAVVAVPEGLVGKVTAVTPHTAEVTLVTDASMKVACEVLLVSGGKVRGILCGGSGDDLMLRHLSRDAGEALVAPRSRVVTSGLGGVFPEGLVVGSWVGEFRGEQDRIQAGRVEPAVDFTTLEDVFIRREK